VSVVAFAERRPVVSRVAASLPVAALWVFFASANLATWRTTHRPVGLGATVLELTIAVLFALRRPAWTTSRSVVAWGATVIGTFGMLAARPAYDPVLGLGSLYLALQLAGAAVALAAALTLGRSFGLVAANRGVCISGLYAVVRHPIYAGYLLAGIGYVLENPSLRNCVLFVAVLGFQAVRIVTEEQCLSADPVYRAYRERVTRRVVPFVL
jgi:protein-S-isoprenylcysteine O-methyltransferase Ste14